MKKTRFILILLLSCVSLWFCKRKPFRKTEVTGRLVNYFSKQPLSNTTVELLEDMPRSSNSSSASKDVIASATTDNSGFFVLKSAQSRNHPKYYLRYSDRMRNFFDTAFNVASSKHDLGDIVSGKYTFNVNVHFKSNTNNCAFIDFPSTSNDLNLSTGQDTTLNFKLTKSYEDFKEGSSIANYDINFSVSAKNCQNSAIITTTPYRIRFDTADTKTILINY